MSRLRQTVPRTSNRLRQTVPRTSKEVLPKMIENQVENYLIKKVSALGGKAWKFVSPGNAGVPDRLITYNSKAFFVEVKRPGGKPRALQKATVAQIRATGMKVYCISTKAQVDELTNLMRSGIIPEERHFDRI
nr:MAG TPA: Nuclease [Caudoviricetes sp.]